MTTPIPGPPAAVLSAVLRASTAHPYNAADPSQRRLGYFAAANAPDLPSLITDVVSMPSFAELDANVAITGWLASQGWGTQGVTTVTTDYTTTPSDAVVLVNAASGPVTVTLGNAAQSGWINPGQRVSVIKTDTSSNNVTVTGTSGQQVGGASFQTLTNTAPYLSEVFDGANWQTWAGAHQGMALLATTTSSGTSGFAKTNGTPTIVSWTAPNDGNMHRVIVNTVQHCTSPETGGAVQVTWTAPDGTTGTAQSLYSGGAGTGSVTAAGVANALVAPNTVVAVVQNSALTVGATTVWADIYGY